MNLVLVGMMGSGKSAVGRLAAERLGWTFCDTDGAVEAAAGRPVSEIFAAEGEAGFRERERQAVAALAQGDRQVIATGGGAVLDPVNREALRRTGLVVWLCAPPEALYHRAKAQGLAARPLLAGPDPLGRLASLAADRDGAYAAAAHATVETDGRLLTDVVTSVVALVHQAEGEANRG